MTDWYPSQVTLQKISQQTALLIRQFPSYTDAFEKAFQEERTFAGPSLCFHFECIRQFGDTSVQEKLDSFRFYEYLYATLASWGMHRMGDTATKLQNFSEFKSQILSQRDRLAELEGFKIWSLTKPDLDTAQGLLVLVLDSMVISKSSAHLVANTKVIHHILPNLVPPVDRRYTLAYFGINQMLPSQKRAGPIFARLFPAFVQVSSQVAPYIHGKVDRRMENWHTSFTKVIDNAIIGALA